MPSATVLVISGHLIWPSLRADDRFTREVIDGLVSLVGAEAISVAVLDGHASGPASAALRGSGVEVVVGPADWAAWLASRWGHYSHVVATGDTLSYPVLEWLADSQPSAAKVSCFDHLSWRAVRYRRAFVDPDEVEGVGLLAEIEKDNLVQTLAGFDAALFARPSDFDWALAATRTPSYLMRPSFSTPCEDQGFFRRSGLAVFASDSYDISAGAESLALSSLEAASRIRCYLPPVPVTLIGDRLSPRVTSSAEKIGVRIVGESEAGECLGAARVAVIVPQYGTAGVGPLLSCIDSRTPAVASSAVAAAAQVDMTSDFWNIDDPISVVTLARQLLTDERTWTRYHGSIDTYARRHPGRYMRNLNRSSEPGPLEGLQTLLADLGLDAYPRSTAVTLGAPADLPPRPGWGVEHPPLRPNGPATGVANTNEIHRHPEDPDERYRLWKHLHAPSLQDLAAITADALSIAEPLIISLVMPVYNTDPAILNAAIASVREQVYEHWELCIADDASTNLDTIAVLADIGSDARIKVVTRSHNGGIAAATNSALGLASGSYIAFLDHDDVLAPHALAQVARWVKSDRTLDVIYSDEDKVDETGTVYSTPHIKPDWSPDLLMSANYINHLTVVRRSLVEAVNGIRCGFDGSQDHDFLLRVTERTERIGHIPEPLYSWRAIEGSAASDLTSKPQAPVAAIKALDEALARRGQSGHAERTEFTTFYRIRYDIPGSPRVSIIVPTHNAVDLLRSCVESVLGRSTYRNYEIVVVDNRSDDPETLSYLNTSPLRVVRYPYQFNYARQMNLAAATCKSDVLIFLNNDTEVLSPNWIETMLEHAMRPEVGAVGCRLYYADGRIQHEGILTGVLSWAWNAFHDGYFARGDLTRNASAVTGACLMIRTSVFNRLGRNDEGLRIAYNDVDLGHRLRQAGYRIVYTPYAELYHYEGATRSGWEHPEDAERFVERWDPLHSLDPYYSPLFERFRPFVLAL